MSKRLFLYILSLFFITTACRDNETDGLLEEDNVPDMTGEMIQFTGVKNSKSDTRAGYEVNDYSYLGKTESDKFYTFDIEMFKKNGSDSVSTGKAKYNIASNDNSGTKTLDQQGSLALSFPAEGETNQPLMWLDNVNRYGFKVTANDNDLNADQSDGNEGESGKNFWANDKLIGFSAAPILNGTEYSDSFDQINYRTSKRWVIANKQILGTAQDENEYKKIPLYIKHERAWITVILKAGAGMERENLRFENTGDDKLRSELFSYSQSSGSTQQSLSINPWRDAAAVKYEADINGDAENSSLGTANPTNIVNNTTALHAIVEPHNYNAIEGEDGKREDQIFKIVLNGQTFSYAPSNDDNSEDGNWNVEQQVYNLKAGQHLTITATLSTDKIVLITAHLEDWEDVIYRSPCDDFGLKGTPKVILNRQQLIDYLNSDDNSPGNYAVINATYIELDVDNGTESNWTPKTLKSSLNLAGHTLYSKGIVFDKIEKNGALINGGICITGDRATEKMKASICETNEGQIEQIKVTVLQNVRNNVYATQGGLVGINYGTISKCSNDLQVKGNSGYIGGIAGESRQLVTKDADGNIQSKGTLPVIDNCVMNGKVSYNGSDPSTDENFLGAGGIVGYAEYRVCNNTFNYGLTISQQGKDTEDNKFKNIVSKTTDSSDLEKVRAYNNAWPTTCTNKIGETPTSEDPNPNTNESNRYYAVIDSQEELEFLITKFGGESNNSFRFRIADDFEITKTVWSYGGFGNKDNVESPYNLYFELDGNNKTITTNGTSIFTNIRGYMHDFTIRMNKSIEITPSNNTESASAFAFAVKGTNGRIANINVESANPGYVIQAPNPAGLVVAANGGAKIENCYVKATLIMVYTAGYDNVDNITYAGGVVAQTTKATITGCKFAPLTEKGIIPDEIVADKHNHYRGGIVGGVAENASERPQTLIIDCASNWGEAPNNNEKASPSGALIGLTVYYENNRPINGIKDGSQGNWWNDTHKITGNLSNNEAVLLLGVKSLVSPTW